MSRDDRWESVDAYLGEAVVHEPPALAAMRAAREEAGLPAIEVAPNQGKLLGMIARMIGARRVLEFGTLAGYSTSWFASAVGPGGNVTTFEIDPEHARVAADNLAAAGLADRVDIVIGPALDSVRRLAESDPEPYDLVFIDADKQNNAAYLQESLPLLRSGGVLIGDNVVRGGLIVDPSASDAAVAGTRDFLAAVGAAERLDATAVQTVGVKGWDGFVLAIAD
jgi:predicted O-methyltransferase YrrM